MKVKSKKSKGKSTSGAPRLYSRGPFVFGIPLWGGIPPECPFIPTFTGGAFWVRGKNFPAKAGSRLEPSKWREKFWILLCNFAFLIFSFTLTCYAKDVTILFTGDTHAALYPCHCPFEPDGGVLRRATLIKQIKRDFPEGLVLDAGGFFAGGVMDEYSLNSELDKQRAKLNLTAMELMGYDAAAISAEEFNFGRAFLEESISRSKVSFISSNIAAAPFKPYFLKDSSGVKVGIIAAIEPGAQSKTQGLKVIEPKAALNQAVAGLRDGGADIIILLSRLGENDDTGIIKSVKGIDVLIRGSGSKGEQAGKLDSTIILSSSWQGRKLGKLTLKMEGKKVQDYKVEYIRLSDQVRDDAELSGLVPACFSDSDCSKKGFIASCQNPASPSASCAFSAPAKLNLQVIRSGGFRNADSERVVDFLKGNFPGLVVDYFTYPGDKSEELIKRFHIQTLPAYILDKKIEAEGAFEKLKADLELVDGFYLARPKASGVFLFLNRKRIPGRVDLFISLYDKDSAVLLEAIRDFNPEVHLLAVEGSGGFDARNGNLEVEEDLRAVCVKRHFPQAFWDYLICRSKNINSSWWEDCLGSFSSEKVRACSRSPEGNLLLRQNTALNRELETVFGPVYLLDNQEIFGTQGVPTKESLKKVLRK